MVSMSHRGEYMRTQGIITAATKTDFQNLSCNSAAIVVSIFLFYVCSRAPQNQMLDYFPLANSVPNFVVRETTMLCSHLSTISASNSAVDNLSSPEVSSC